MNKLFEEYIEEILKESDCPKRKRKEVAEELRGHLEEIQEEYLLWGYEETRAAESTLADMGAIEEIKEEFAELFRFQRRKRWKYIAKGTTAACLFSGLSAVMLYCTEISRQHQEFCKGVVEGRVMISSEQFTNELYQRDYWKNDKVRDVIRAYNEEKSKYGFMSMVVTEHVYITATETWQGGEYQSDTGQK